MAKLKEYAVYKGEEVLAIGTLEDIAKKFLEEEKRPPGLQSKRGKEK